LECLNNLKIKKMVSKKEIERGSAHIYIDMRKGNITVYHGDNMKSILFQIKNAEDGSWDKIWRTIRSLKSVK